MKQGISVEEGRRAFAHHVTEKALALRGKYGSFIDFETLKTILKDRDFVRYPTRLEFNSARIDPGLFAVVIPVAGISENEYVIYVHEHFKNKLGDVPALVFYHLVLINYGEMATREEAELFGATVLGMEREEYYQLLCRLADQIPA